MPGGLRPGRDQRRRHAPRPPYRRHARLQSARGRRPLRRPEDGLGHRRLRQARRGSRDHPRRSPGLRRARQQENRWTARMRYLVQELGPEGFREELAQRVSIDLTPAGEDLTKRYRGDHIGVHPQRGDGFQPRPYYVGLNVPVGRMSGEQFEEAGRLAGEYGDGVRLATDQNLILTGVPEDRLDELLAEPLLARYSPNPGAFERGVVACTGSEFCRFGIVETKVRAVEWAREMDEWVGDLGQEAVRMHFSGCSASCAQPQIGDIGFRGETAK